MKRPFLLIVFSCLLFSLWGDEDPMLGFILGSYLVVGQYPDQGAPYQGRLSISVDEDGGIMVTRVINGKDLPCAGEISHVFEGEVTVFIITFTEKGQEYKGFYLISSDLDNYARLTGYIYTAGETETVPGLEALFPDIFRE